MPLIIAPSTEPGLVSHQIGDRPTVYPHQGGAF
jgi:hypothetical protein